MPKDKSNSILPLTASFRDAVRKGASDFSQKKNYLPIDQIMQTARGSNGQIADVRSTSWWSPLQPIAPMAPADQRPRQRAILPGENIIWTPGSDKLLSYDTLRDLADTWDVLRLIIETRKDQLCSLDWEIRVTQSPGEKNKDRKQRQLEDPNVKKLKAFFEKPDGQNPWKRWLRMWLEDSLVLDAVALWYERDKTGKIANVIPLDGATINRLMTEQGLTPPPPSVAYQQVLYGVPAFNLTTDDLMFSMRNPRTNHRYGYSRIEQMMATIGTGIRSQDFLLKYYTDGNMPEAMVFLPSDLGIDRVKEIQNWFDAIMSGDLANRRRLRFLPGYGTGDNVKPNVVFPKEALLKSPTDEWIVQIACFCFGLSAQPFLKMMNRATAQQAAETAQAEGLKPDADYVSEVVNQIVDDLGYGEKYEFAWQERRDVDPKAAAETDAILVGKIYTVNEIREARGDDPSEAPEADMLGTFGVNGFIPLNVEDAVERQQTLNPSQPDDGTQPAPPPGKKKPDAKPVDAKGNKKVHALPSGAVGFVGGTQLSSGSIALAQYGRISFLGKSGSKPYFQNGDLTTKSERAEVRINKGLKKVFKAQQKKTRLLLADHLDKLAKSKEDDLLDELLRNIDAEFDDVPTWIAADLEASILSGVEQGFLQLDIKDEDLLTSVNEIARDWASKRAAELVGRRRNEDGELVPNPNAEMAISETTRDEIQRIISHSFEEEMVTIDQVADRIQASGIFSDSRAEMIARTEVNRAQTEGNYKVWEESGLVQSVEWLKSNDEGVCDDCESNDGVVVPIGQAFPSGAVKPGDDHPNCRCVVVAASVGETQ